jgi:nitroreductase
MGEVPMMIFACIQGRPIKAAGAASAASLYGSIIPAAWSLMLALRARGIGAAWTTLHLVYEKKCNKILGIPKNVTTAALLPVAYFTGETFKKAKRVPARELTYWEAWGMKGDD